MFCVTTVRTLSPASSKIVKGAILPHFVELDLAIAASAEDNLDSFHEINLKLSSLLAVPLPVRLRGFP